MERLTWLMVLRSGALEVAEDAHLREELVKNKRLGLNEEAKVICLCDRSHRGCVSAPPPLST